MNTPTAIAADFASQFDALDATKRADIARAFEATYVARAAEGGDEDDCYAAAYHRDDCYGLLSRFERRPTGGADWSVYDCYAIVRNDDEEGLFVLYDDDGSWSLVARWLDHDEDAVIEEIACSDEWPEIVNLAHRFATMLAGRTCR